MPAEPKRAASSVAALMELTLAIALALGAVLAHHEAIRLWFVSIHGVDARLLPYRLFLSAFAVVLGLGLAIERLRGAGPGRDWGPGRFTIALTAAAVLAVLADDLAHGLIRGPFTAKTPQDWWGEAGLVLGRAWNWFPNFLLGAWAALLAMGRRTALRADLREWTGRAIAAGFVALAVARFLAR